jgi:hypothetical protein
MKHGKINYVSDSCWIICVFRVSSFKTEIWNEILLQTKFKFNQKQFWSWKINVLMKRSLNDSLQFNFVELSPSVSTFEQMQIFWRQCDQDWHSFIRVRSFVRSFVREGGREGGFKIRISSMTKNKQTVSTHRKQLQISSLIFFRIELIYETGFLV